MPFRTLNSTSIITTLDQLASRIRERFPEAGLAQVAEEMGELARRDAKRTRRLNRPNLFIRFGVLLALVAGAAGLGWVVWNLLGMLEIKNGEVDAFTIFEGVEAALNTVILVGVALFALLRTEERSKRAAALADLHELRSIAHVVDMHQLTKDPTAMLGLGPRTQSSPVREMTPFELSRYLDYSAEMLALVGKLAALYAQSSRDPVVIASVNDIETLVNGLTGKIWQKINLIRAANDAGMADD